MTYGKTGVTFLSNFRGLKLAFIMAIAAMAQWTYGATCVSPPPGLVGWWRAEGNATNSAGTNNATLQGGATATAAGMVGTSFSFNGTNQYVQVTDGPAVRPTNLTIECWVRFNNLNSLASGGSPPGDQYIVFHQNTRSSDFEGYDLSKTRLGGVDVFRFLVTSATAQLAEIESVTPLTTNVWYHVAAVRGSNFSQIYVNGVLERQTNVNFVQNYGNFPLYFGSSGQTNFWDHKLSGNLDEVSLYNRALAGSEIAAIYAAGPAGKCVSGAPPSITGDPQNQTLPVGTNATFTVTATGTPPLAYQWQLAGAPIAGATNSSLTLTNVQITDSGNYSAVVTNSSGSATSGVAVLTVLAPPSIITQPLSATNIAGTIASFTADAGGSAPLSLRWRLNGTPLTDGGRISGAATLSLTISNAQPADVGNYTLVVTNQVGASTSAPAALTIISPPAISIPPSGLIVPVGSNVVLNVTATGTPPLAYQWRKDGQDLSDGGNVTGANTSSLALSAAQTIDSGGYSVVVANAAGSVTSAVAVVTVLLPPAIISQPQSATNVAGTTASFSADAAGSAPLSLRWRLNGTPLTDGGRISGAATLSLTISNAQGADAGNYTLVVTNLIGATTSAPAALSIMGPPVITVPPANQTVPVGSNAVLNVTATGTQPLAYQWRKEGQNLSDGGSISGATTSSLSLSAVQTNNGGNYTVVVSNSAGSITSSVAVVTVLVPPAITAQPQNATNAAGTIASFTANAVGSAPLTLQWRFNGTNLANGGRISGANSLTLTISNAQPADAGPYTLQASNQIGIATSVAATLTIISPPTITVPPASQTVPTGTNVVLNVTATGTAPLGYQWRKGGTNLSNGGNVSGASTSSLSLSGVQTNDSGNYSVVVSNFAGSVTSAVAVVTVLAPPAITGQPQSATNVTGTIASFTANATGGAPLTFRWRLNGNTLTNGGRISGANTLTLTISNAQPADAGPYTLQASNQVGVVTSVVATLTILSPPGITGQPGSQTVPSGSNVTFSVTATGTAPLAYQWRKDGLNLSNGGAVSGATTSALGLTGVQTNDAAGYSVVVTNIAGAVTSAVATLTVTAPGNGNCVNNPSGIVGWWPADGSAIDIIGGNNGTLQGGATASAAGEVAQAFTFSGTNQFVQLPDVAALRPAVFTIECWVRFTGLDSQGSGGSPAGDQYIIFKQNTRSSNFEGIDFSKSRRAGGDVFRFLVTSSTGVEAEVDSTTFITVNTWYHVGLVRSATNMQIYVNGQLQGQLAVSFAQNYGNFPLYFGTSGQSFWDHKFKGNLDEVSIYNRVLSGSEIAAIYAAGTAGKCKGAIPPSILVQPTNQILVLGGVAGFSVSAAGTAPLSYRWTKDSLNLTDNGHVTGSLSPQLVISNLVSTDAGNYQVVINNSAGSVTSIVASLSTGIPPGNDNFAAATAISGSNGSINGNNANATKQSGEPNHAGNAGGVSIWYNWTAPSTSPVTFDTCMSSVDTLLAVYTGNNVNSLTLVASNNDASANNPRSRLTFTPVAGTVYHVAVDGNNADNGNIVLRWIQASVPLCDLQVVGSALGPQIVTQNFSPSSCAVVEGLIPAGTRRIIRFNTETENHGNADLFFGNPANNPLFVFAPCHAHYHFQNYMAYRLRNSSGALAAVGLKVGFCVLDVFRWQGGAPNQAKYTCSNQGIQVGWGDLYDSTLDGQWIDTTGLPDGNYVIEIEPNPLGVIQESNYANNIVQVPITIGNASGPPFNDNFASAQTLPGTFSSISGVNSFATKQSGEPNHAGNAGGHSIWYQWTAVDNKPVTIDTIGSSFDTLLGVYTGSSVSALTAVTNNDDIVPGTNKQSKVTFNATAGVLYRIAVDGFNGATGSVVLTLNQTIQNDNFTGCEFVGGPTGTARGANTGGTKESGEPNHAGNAGGSSIWYCWTAPIGGTVTFDTVGSTFNTLLAAYTGSAVNNLTPIASNDDITPGSNLQSSMTFDAVGLTMYHIAIDGFNGASGNTTLHWNLVGGGQSPNLVGVLASDTGALVANQAAVLSYSFLPEGEFKLSIKGMPQAKYRIERSCNLSTWVPLAPTVADFDGQAWFTDKSATHSKTSSGDPVCGPNTAVGVSLSPTEARFYRAILVPAN